ncbi:Ribonuclease H [Cellulomonas flavigena DSM 20109]|uniref:Ribonuclease n=1 Tax=Cellulomonas flavigena (strain ATCC 482 / DSM 20109 / BCRC 11376 / JCM 18109 / NBRC 3775 / NCIMB 8073 / NRS 134) TaxID=446466 RepID=D5UD37_CELFN|nr:ribonuclease HII [Cellulomonas flavigena]ADG74374.1 Ribonuclease H [Cellulomonas flavigena DSM 20109]
MTTELGAPPTRRVVASTTRPARRAAPRPVPHLRHERALLRTGLRYVAGMDEVGRGSLAGPVSVGVVVVDVGTRSAPRGVADSKLLTPAARAALLPSLGRWGVARAVGHASPTEIDDRGIVAALRLAGTRALRSVLEVVEQVDAVVLDGSHDWLTPPEPDLFGTQSELFAPSPDLRVPAVHLRVKADRSCATVAAASVLAKCERDALMVQHAAAHPEYRWDENKGYASPEHVAALRELGPTPLHRRSWRLPTVQEPAVATSGEGWHTQPLLPDEVLRAPS